MLTPEQAKELEAQFNKELTKYLGKPGVDPSLRMHQRALADFFYLGHQQAGQPEEGKLLKGEVINAKKNSARDIDYTIRVTSKEFTNLNGIQGVLVTWEKEDSEEEING